MPPPVSTPPDLRVREIPPGQSLKPFVDLTWQINSRDATWVPPLRMSLNSALDRERHPFHRHADVAYFLAEREGRPTGRIAAIVNRLHNDFHGDRTGFFGLFECENDNQAAAALFDAAAGWLRQRGMDLMRGPMNFSTNEEVSSPGVLVDGFDFPPAVMMSHNPPYYADLHEALGFRPSKDLLAFILDRPEAPPQRGRKLMDRILARENVTIAPLDLKKFSSEVAAIKEVYNAAWSKNWGFVPMTDEEIDYLGRELRPVIDPELCLIGRSGDEPVGFSVALPDLNEALRHIPNGRLLPLGWIKFFWHRRKIRGIRVLTLGFKPRLHHAGLGSAFYATTWETGVRKGYVRGEASWILEDNREMVRALERMGGRPYKRYRVYERSI